MSDEIRAYSHPSTNRRMLELIEPVLAAEGRVLDVGAGEGFFSQSMGELLRRRKVEPASRLQACDLFPGTFRYADLRCDPLDAADRFPYEDDSFDAAVSVEVVEHLENQFQFVRELHRVVKPGGRAFVSTPNLTNINSRLRFLHSGFWLLFDPLPLSSHDPVHTAGHIAPVAYYYLAYMFRRAGFDDVRVHFDRHKRSAAALAAPLYPVIWLGHVLFRQRLRRKEPATYSENERLVEAINRWEMLTARSVIVEGRK